MIVEPPGIVAYDSIVLRHERRTKRAYLLLHGLTASPLQFAEFGRRLFEGGANVSIPRLPRHGHADRLTTALADLTGPELACFAEDAVSAARPLGEELVVVGFSVGGLLSSLVAQRCDVASVVSIAPFVGLKWLPAPLARNATRLALASPNRFMWWDPVRREMLGPVHGYPQFSSHAVAHAVALARDLLAEARATPPRTAKIRFVLNASETTVSNRAVLRLARAWRYHGNEVAIDRLCGLPLSHDIIEPLRAGRLAARVYPELLGAVRG